MAGNHSAVKVHIDHVVKKFNGRNGEMVALNGVDMDIHENEFICVVGPSGCGKSTLLNIIGGLETLGAKQKDIFFKITIPASTPFILVAARLGLSTSMTTLMASEIVGGDKGIGMMIQQANGYYQMDVMLMGIILLGIIGICFEKIVKFLERRFTGWQETIQQ